MRERGTTFDTVREIGRELSGVEESTSYGTPALKVNGKLVARLKEDGESLVLVLGFDNRDILMEANPEAFYITEHYRGYPALLAHLSRIDRAQLRDVLEMAYRFVIAKGKRKRAARK